MVKRGPITLTLSDDLSELIRRRMDAGQFASAEAVVRAALCLLSDGPWRDDARAARAKIQQGIDELDRGEVVDGDQALDEWDADVRGRASGDSDSPR